MTDLRTAAQQALEALEALQGGCTDHDDGTVEAITVWCPEIITALKAALAEPCPCGDRPAARCPGEWEPGCDLGNNPKYARRVNLAQPVQEPDIEDTIEAAYWHFDARKNGLNEWRFAPQSERDAFKAEARKLVKGYFPTRQAQDTKREMLAVADAFIRGKRAALAEPVQEPDYWQEEARRYAGNADYWRKRYEALAEPVQEPVREPVKQCMAHGECFGGECIYTAPPQRKPLSDEALEAMWEADTTSAEDCQSLYYFKVVARAVEAAHGIKEGK